MLTFFSLQRIFLPLQLFFLAFYDDHLNHGQDRNYKWGIDLLSEVNFV